MKSPGGRVMDCFFIRVKHENTDHNTLGCGKDNVVQTPKRKI